MPLNTVCGNKQEGDRQKKDKEFRQIFQVEIAERMKTWMHERNRT